MVTLLWVKKLQKFVQFVLILRLSLRFAQLITKTVLENKPHVGLIFCKDFGKNSEETDRITKEEFVILQDASVSG